MSSPAGSAPRRQLSLAQLALARGSEPAAPVAQRADGLRVLAGAGPDLATASPGALAAVLAEARALHALCVIDAGSVRQPAAEPALAGADVVVWVAHPARLDAAAFASPLVRPARGARWVLALVSAARRRRVPRALREELAAVVTLRRSTRWKGQAAGGGGAAGAGGARMSRAAPDRRPVLAGAGLLASLTGLALVAALVAAAGAGARAAELVRVRAGERAARSRQALAVVARRTCACSACLLLAALGTRERRLLPALDLLVGVVRRRQRRARRARARRLRPVAAARGSRTCRSSGRHSPSRSPPTSAPAAARPASAGDRQSGRARRRAARARGRRRGVGDAAGADDRDRSRSPRCSWPRRSPSPRRRLAARRGAATLRVRLVPGRTDEATPDELQRLFEVLHQLVLRRWWQRLLARPAVARARAVGPARARRARRRGSRSCCPTRRALVQAVRGRLLATYRDVLLQPWDGQPVPGPALVRLKKREPFITRLRTPEDYAAPLVDAVLAAMAELAEPVLVQLALTPTPALFDRVSRWRFRAEEHARERARLREGGDPGLRSEVVGAELEGGLHVQHRPLFFCDLRVAAATLDGARLVARALRGESAQENRLVERTVRAPRAGSTGRGSRPGRATRCRACAAAWSPPRS